MDVGMAVHAAAGDGAGQSAAGGAAARQCARLTAVARVAMAFLAEERRARLQQAGDGGAVRLVADAAVFLHRWMAVHERPALLHVAGVAGLGRAIARQLLRIAAMHVMAGGARHLPFGDRMVHRPVHLHALLLVAGEAGVALRYAVAHRIARRVHQVARAAGYVGARMRAHLPLDARAALVASEARLGARIDRRLRVLAEADLRLGPRPGATPALVAHVRFARAVAAGAARRARVGARAVLGGADREHRVAVVLIVAARALRVAVQHAVLGSRILPPGGCAQKS